MATIFQENKERLLAQLHELSNDNPDHVCAIWDQPREIGGLDSFLIQLVERDDPKEGEVFDPDAPTKAVNSRYIAVTPNGEHRELVNIGFLNEDVYRSIEVVLDVCVNLINQEVTELVYNYLFYGMLPEVPSAETKAEK